MSHDEQNTQAALTRWLEQVGSAAALQAMAESHADRAVFVVDGDRRILLWSPGAEKLLGYRAADVVGENCHTANRCQQCNMGCGLSELGRVNLSLTLYSASGEPINILKTGRAFYDDKGEFIGGVEVLRPAPKIEPGKEESGATPLEGLQSFHEFEQFHGIYTRERQMIQIFQTVRNVAETDTTILVRGESGTGKELVARAIHQESHRAAGPFVPVNCAALTANLLESELFGHVRGAFTGAVNDRPGLFRQAHGGSLFLDEVGELPIELQAKLLRVIETREVVPVGGTHSKKVDVRLIAATHRSLRREVAAGRFREDLMFRLRVVPLFLPTLKQRPADIELLLWRFIEVLNQRGPRHIDRIVPTAMRALLDHHWPGNVRELRNVVEYAFAVGRSNELLVSELPPEFRENDVHAANPPIDDEQTSIRKALTAARGNIGKAAETLGISRATLWRKRKKYGL